MKIAIFSGNHPRHLALVRAMSAIAEVYLVQECKTVHTGKIEDRIAASDMMDRYFCQVRDAEADIFGSLDFVSGPVHHLALRHGDLSGLDAAALEKAFACDLLIVFGASYIRGEICERMIARRAVNIHLGVSPYYRGSACNFWALHDGRPDLVGATVHYLSKGLDDGDILFHALPGIRQEGPFHLGMRAVEAAILGLRHVVEAEKLWTLPAVRQDRSKTIRYSRNAEFSDDVAVQYLSSPPTEEQIGLALMARDLGLFVNPFIAGSKQ